jgi:hypothetical protein
MAEPKTKHKGYTPENFPPRKRIFSKTYDACPQARFEEALNEGRYAEAAKILESLLHHNASAADPIYRTLTMMEGYRAIAEEFIRENLREDPVEEDYLQETRGLQNDLDDAEVDEIVEAIRQLP